MPLNVQPYDDDEPADSYRDFNLNFSPTASVSPASTRAARSPPASPYGVIGDKRASAAGPAAAVAAPAAAEASAAELEAVEANDAKADEAPAKAVAPAPREADKMTATPAEIPAPLSTPTHVALDVEVKGSGSDFWRTYRVPAVAVSVALVAGLLYRRGKK